MQATKLGDPIKKQQITITESELLSIIAREFFAQQIQEKEMLISTSSEIFESAVSPIINEVKYFIDHYKKENKFRLKLIMYKSDGEHFRQVEITYKEILEDTIKYQLPHPAVVANQMFITLSKITDEQWNAFPEKAEPSPLIF